MKKITVEEAIAGRVTLKNCGEKQWEAYFVFPSDGYKVTLYAHSGWCGNVRTTKKEMVEWVVERVKEIALTRYPLKADNPAFYMCIKCTSCG